MRELCASLESCRHRDNFRLLGCALEIVLRALRCCAQIGFAHDVIAVEDAASLVPADAHGDFLRHPGADHVPNA